MVIAREDRDLALQDRLALALHMAICKTCPVFERQVLTMRNALHQWRNYAGPEGDHSPPNAALKDSE